ncbi:MAG: hypothetical protein BWY42_01494 [Candidatus Omnitrophica bacterium ADurb.Bin277]|nr:MAG: hypothetical protein BWY42_01494 [Candidatus Omnitrophica bacterium ADurb.Bin277]
MLKLTEMLGDDALTGFNGLRAGASVKQRHIQAFLDIRKILETLNLDGLAIDWAGQQKPMTARSGVNVAEFTDYPSRALIFSGGDLSARAAAAFRFVDILIKTDIPFNVIVRRGHVYVFPRSRIRAEIFPGRAGIAELSGLFNVSEEITDAQLVEALGVETASEKLFDKLKEAYQATDEAQAEAIAAAKEIARLDTEASAAVFAAPEKPQSLLTEEQEAALRMVAANYGKEPYIAKYVRMALLYFGRSADSKVKEVESVYVAAKPDGEGFPKTEFSSIKGNDSLKELAKTAVIQVLSLDGGLGEKLRRSLWKSWLLTKGFLSGEGLEIDAAGSPRLGAKGTDMGYFVKLPDGKIVYVSVSESKLINLYRQGQQSRFKGLSFRAIVNAASRPSYEALFEKPNLLGITAEGSTVPMTYRELLASVNVRVDDFLFQDKVPGLRLWVDKTGKEVFLPSVSSQGYEQEAGHGQIGVLTVINPEDYVPRTDGAPDFLVFTNGDAQVSSDISPEIIGDMIRNGRAIGNLVTPATRTDRKGGKYIIRLLEYLGTRRWIPGQRELAAAKELGEESESNFYKAGQPDGAPVFGADSVGKQPFNINAFYIDQARLMPFLADLKRVMGEDAYLAEVISPNFMKKDTKPGKDGYQYFPIDSAIGNVYHNINEFVMKMILIGDAGAEKLTGKQKEILEVFEKHRMREVIHYYNVPRTMFTPQKNPLDALLQMLGGYYRYDLETGNLTETESGLVPPEVVIVDSQGKAQDSGAGYYSEFSNMLRTFVSTDSIESILTSSFDIRKLDKLEIRGNISVWDTVFVGNVAIINQGTSEQVFDVREAILKNPGLRDQVGYREGQPLKLENVRIAIDETGNVSIEPVGARSEVRDDKGASDLPTTMAAKSGAESREQAMTEELKQLLAAAGSVQEAEFGVKKYTEIFSPESYRVEDSVVRSMMSSLGVEELAFLEGITSVKMVYDVDDLYMASAVQLTLLNPNAKVTLTVANQTQETTARTALSALGVDFSRITFEVGADVVVLARTEASRLGIDVNGLSRSVIQLRKTKGAKISKDDLKAIALLSQMNEVIVILNSEDDVGFAMPFDVADVLRSEFLAAESIARSA